jgi:hypothetical protein
MGDDNDDGNSLEDILTTSSAASVHQLSSRLYERQSGYDLVNPRMRKGMLLLPYITENLDEHCYRVSPSDKDTRSEILRLFNCKSVEFWVELYWSFRDRDRIHQNLGPLHMACLLGLKLLVEDMLKDKWTWETPANAPDGAFTTPLETAVEGGDSDVVNLRLDNGANVH